MKRVRDIYDHLQDDRSKYLFENRLLYGLTGKQEYIDRIVRSFLSKIELDRIFDFCRKHIDDVVIYGAGNDLSVLSSLYPGFKFKYICDGSIERQRTGWNGIRVMSPDELMSRKEYMYVVILTSRYFGEIESALLENGFKKERIINVGKMIDALYVEQYFDKDIMTPLSGEIFVDGGCFDCGTDEIFAKWCNGDHKKIYAFEPDLGNYEKCLKECERAGISKIQIYNKGLWDHETDLFFMETGGAGSKISGESIDAVKISTVAIDDIVGDDKVTFIKLDVEGAELKALQGAEKTICRYHPRLAVCVYHKPEDILEIPEFVLSLHSDYRLFIRHYRLDHNETILYAV